MSSELACRGFWERYGKECRDALWSTHPRGAGSRLRAQMLDVPDEKSRFPGRDWEFTKLQPLTWGFSGPLTPSE